MFPLTQHAEPFYGTTSRKQTATKQVINKFPLLRVQNPIVTNTKCRDTHQRWRRAVKKRQQQFQVFRSEVAFVKCHAQRQYDVAMHWKQGNTTARLTKVEHR